MIQGAGFQAPAAARRFAPRKRVRKKLYYSALPRIIRIGLAARAFGVLRPISQKVV